MSLEKLRSRGHGAIMGIDCSTNSMAWSIFIDSELVEWGQIHFKGRSLEDRLIFARKALSLLNFDVDRVFIEQAVYVNNKRTIIAMAMMLGVIVSCIEPKEVTYLTPPQWGKVIGNSGLSTAQKQEVKRQFPGKTDSWYKTQFREARKDITKQWVINKFKVNTDSPEWDDNAADAIAIGFSGVTLTSN